jgi:hypothetical protein
VACQPWLRRSEGWRGAEDLHPNRRGRSVCFRNSARALAGSLSGEISKATSSQCFQLLARANCSRGRRPRSEFAIGEPGSPTPATTRAQAEEDLLDS